MAIFDTTDAAAMVALLHMALLVVVAVISSRYPFSWSESVSSAELCMSFVVPFVVVVVFSSRKSADSAKGFVVDMDRRGDETSLSHRCSKHSTADIRSLRYLKEKKMDNKFGFYDKICVMVHLLWLNAQRTFDEVDGNW